MADGDFIGGAFQEVAKLPQAGLSTLFAFKQLIFNSKQYFHN
jgi:hypothetical protein